MAYVITKPCIGVKDTACVEVCPVDCIHPTRLEAQFEAQEMLYITGCLHRLQFVRGRVPGEGDFPG